MEILAAYASEHGSTAEVARPIAGALGAQGHEAHQRSAVVVTDVGDYDAVVLAHEPTRAGVPGALDSRTIVPLTGWLMPLPGTVRAVLFGLVASCAAGARTPTGAAESDPLHQGV